MCNVTFLHLATRKVVISPSTVGGVDIGRCGRCRRLSLVVFVFCLFIVRRPSTGCGCRIGRAWASHAGDRGFEPWLSQTIAL